MNNSKKIWNNLFVLFSGTRTGYKLLLDQQIFTKNFIKQKSLNSDILLNTTIQNYAIETIIGESSIIGFEPLSYKKNSDGSKTIILERLHQENIEI